MVLRYWKLTGFSTPVKTFCCSQHYTKEAAPVPLVLYNKASGYTTSLVTLQGMRTKVSVWNPEVGTFLKRLIQFLNRGLKTQHSRTPLQKRISQGWHYFRKVLDKALDLNLLSPVILTGFWDHFRSLNERPERTVLERSQGLCQYKLRSCRNGRTVIGMLASHTAWVTAVTGASLSRRLGASTRGRRQGTSNWERMAVASCLVVVAVLSLLGFFLSTWPSQMCSRWASAWGIWLDQLLLLCHFRK